ncbi:hypothetical protein GHT07_18975 [Caenimonas koreensis DSM 17982]|uniref:Uncharacterized protein n=1 Tax=Caenimonas koreensis DSM 17982 TaxID=1121255 RepID=A0A844AZB3_9BURK|nr:hypothetical protein [Caenimonas koreensis]MRD49364.1 hypothetical protein [Caenimonas koreensis DSM 17982]
MADFVILRLERKSVAALNLRAPLYALEQMIVSAGAVREFAGRVRIEFEGCYELGEVWLDACVQRYMRELTDLFPYWLHFVDKEDESLRILMCCLLPPQQVEPHGNGEPQMQINVLAWNDQLRRLRLYMSRLHAQYGLSPEESSAIDQLIAAWSRRVGLTPA